MLTFICQSF